MESNELIRIDAVVPLHPGLTVCEYLEAFNWSQRELARRTGLTPKTISEICNEKAPITPTTALTFENVLQRPAHFWLNLQRQYDEEKARRKHHESMNKWLQWAHNFPLEEMRKFKFSVPPAESEVDALLGFFGVSSPDSWYSVWNTYGVAYRQTRKFTKSVEAITAWVRETELVASEIHTQDFNEQLLRSLLPKIRRLTQERVEEVLETVQSLCASAGIAVVWVPELPHTGISGCARWLSKNRALIGLTLRYKTDDQMWFSLFHEIGHVLLHKNKRSFVLDNAEEDLSDRIVDPEMQAYEGEANQFAADTLIPPAALNAFLKAETITNESIYAFAKEMEIGPGIVVGRLQHERYLAPHQGNAFKQKLKWKI